MNSTLDNSLAANPATGSFPSDSYPDKWLLFIVIPLWGFLLRHIGEPVPIYQLLNDPQYYLDLLYAVFVTASIWLMNRMIVLKLDRRYSWVSHTFQRFFIQAMVAYGGTFLFMLLISFLYNEFLINRAEVFNINNVFSADIPTSLLYVTIIHMLYTGMWMVKYHKQTMEALQRKLVYWQQQTPQALETKSWEEPKKRTLLVHQGKGLVPVATEQIAYIFLANEVSIVRTLSGQSYTVDGTLEQLTEQLPSQDFFRISRQCIVQKGAIRKVDNETSGRLLLHIQPEHTEQLTVSRRRAPDFKLWMAR